MLDYKEILSGEVGQVIKLHNELAYFIQRETKDEYWDFGILSEDSARSHLEGFIDNPERKIFVAKNDEKIVGFIAGEIMQCHLPISSIAKVGYISGAYVLPEYRGKGIMGKLDNLIVGFFKDYGLKFVELHFITNNIIARETWNSLGYKTFREQARKRV